MMLGGRVGCLAFGAVGFDVDSGRAEVRNVVEELVFDRVCELVGFDDAERGRDTDWRGRLGAGVFPSEPGRDGRR